MALTFLVIGLFSFLGGGLMMILATNYHSIDAERYDRRDRLEHEAAPPVSSPLALRDASARAELVAALERYLERERSLVSEFLTDPSIDSLYRRKAERLSIS